MPTKCILSSTICRDGIRPSHPQCAYALGYAFVIFLVPTNPRPNAGDQVRLVVEHDSYTMPDPRWPRYPVTISPQALRGSICRQIPPAPVCGRWYSSKTTRVRLSKHAFSVATDSSRSTTGSQGRRGVYTPMAKHMVVTRGQRKFDKMYGAHVESCVAPSPSWWSVRPSTRRMCCRFRQWENEKAPHSPAVPDTHLVSGQSNRLVSGGGKRAQLVLPSNP